jgi:hypothetical protein
LKLPLDDLCAASRASKRGRFVCSSGWVRGIRIQVFASNKCGKSLCGVVCYGLKDAEDAMVAPSGRFPHIPKLYSSTSKKKKKKKKKKVHPMQKTTPALTYPLTVPIHCQNAHVFTCTGRKNIIIYVPYFSVCVVCICIEKLALLVG